MTVAVQLTVTGGEVAVGRREGDEKSKRRTGGIEIASTSGRRPEESCIQANFWRARRGGEKLAMPRGVVPLLPRGANASP